MRHALRVASLSCALFAAQHSALPARAELTSAEKKSTPFRGGVTLRAAPDVDAQTIALRQSLFKRTVPSAPAGDLTPRTTSRRSEPAVRRAIPVPVLPPRPIAPDPPDPRPDVAPRRLPPEALRALGVQATSFTPYDRYMTSARAVIEQAAGNPATLSVACRLIEVGRSYRYISRDPYRPDLPEVTAQRRAGDCKSKALWLYKQLNDPAALYVIGKADLRAKTSHAWVYWFWQGRWWILDPTTRSSPVAASSVPAGRYVPYYSFGRDGTYRHKATRIFGAREETPAVAEKRFLFFPVSQSSASRSRSR